MGTANLLRELSRRRALVGLVAVVAVLSGLMVGFRISPLPPKLESRTYKVGVATTRLLVDTPNSQVVDVSPKGSETLGSRASLLSTLMTEGSVKADVARRVGLRPRQLVATAEFGAGSEDGPPPRKPGPDSHVLTTRVLTNTVGEQLPIIEIAAQAPDARAAAALAEAAVASLSLSLESRAASESVAKARRLRVSPLGPPQTREASRGAGRLMALVAAIFVFAIGCGLILLFQSLARSWREGAAPAPRFAAQDGTSFKGQGRDGQRGSLLVLPGSGGDGDDRAAAARNRASVRDG